MLIGLNCEKYVSDQELFAKATAVAEQKKLAPTLSVHVQWRPACVAHKAQENLFIQINVVRAVQSSHIENRIILICGTLRLRIAGAPAPVLIGNDKSWFEHEEGEQMAKISIGGGARVEDLDLRRFETLAF